MLVLVRLAPEINLKSKPVKTRFLKVLMSNIHIAMRSTGNSYQVEKQWNRLFVKLSEPSDIKTLAKVFGIFSLSPVEYSCPPSLDAMKEIVTTHYSNTVKGKSFAIKARRKEISHFTSKDIENELGATLKKYAQSVDLKNPEVKIEVEARADQAFFFQKRIPGPGGLPLTTEGRALCLISGGFDSAVAAWQLMKRGVALDFVFCSLAGKSYTKAVIAVAQNLAKNWAYGYEPKFFILDFNPMREAILGNAKNQYAQVLLKRAMYKTANLLATQNKKWQAIITGECVGQVSSQTLHNLATIDEASSLPVLRPLISFDKEEIITCSRKIGVYEMCAPIKEHCALSPVRPITQGRLEAVLHQESFINQELYSKCVAELETLSLKSLDPLKLLDEYAYCTDIPQNAAIIDCRTKEEFDTWHHPDAVRMDLGLLASSYKHFKKTQPYVLCCAIGVQTATIAEVMQKDGFEAYSFRGGIPALKKMLNRP